MKHKLMVPENVMQNLELPFHERVDRLERYMLTMPQLEYPTREFFGEDTYMREIVMSAGSFAVGRIHRFDHLSVMVSGELYMWTEDDDLIHLKGYNPVRAKQGVRRVGYIVQDTTWLTFHKIGEGVGPENVMDYLSTVNYEEYLKYKENEMMVLAAPT
jgi:hypothetical protein